MHYSQKPYQFTKAAEPTKAWVQYAIFKMKIEININMKIMDQKEEAGSIRAWISGVNLHYIYTRCSDRNVAQANDAFEFVVFITGQFDVIALFVDGSV